MTGSELLRLTGWLEVSDRVAEFIKSISSELRVWAIIERRSTFARLGALHNVLEAVRAEGFSFDAYKHLAAEYVDMWAKLEQERLEGKP